MPRAIITFHLPREQNELTLALSAGELLTNLSEIRSYVRQRLKYGELSASARKELETLQHMIDYELLERIG